MKKIIFLLSLALSAPVVHASHMNGAEIFYEYIGDSTQVPHQYQVYVNLYRNFTNNNSRPSSYQAEAGSSCFSTLSFNINRYYEPGDSVLPNNGVYIEDYGKCVDQNDPGFMPVSLHRYRGTVTLPGLCGDVIFSWREMGRQGSVSNLQSPTGKYFYVEAHLNNVRGPNSSPRFTNAGAAAFCVGQHVMWPQAVIEPNGDSISFELAHPLTYPRDTIPFTSSYSVNQPITTASGVSFDNSLMFTPTNPEVVVVKVKAREYRYDTLTTVWMQRGTSERDMQVVILGSCDSSAAQLEVGVSDTLSIRNGRFELPCNTDSIYLSTSKPVLCQSITDDKFRLIGLTDSVARPIVGAGPINCASNGYTSGLWLELHQSLAANDSFILQIQKGIDSLTLVNSCGYMLPEYYRLEFFVQDCSVGIEEREGSPISLYPNPTNGTVRIELEEHLQPAQLSLSDPTGKLIGIYEIRNERNIDLELSGPPGLYFLKVETSGMQKVYKLLKK